MYFLGRRVMPGGPQRPGIEVETRQVARKGRLDSFHVELRTGGHELVVDGVLVGSQMRVERRLDGAFIDNNAAREALVAIDVSSVTTLLLLAHIGEEGPLPILRFDEALELEVVRWDLKLEEDGDHALRTPNGFKLASFEENGALRAGLEVAGAAQTQVVSTEIETYGGPGLPLPDAKRALVRARARGRGGPRPPRPSPRPGSPRVAATSELRADPRRVRAARAGPAAGLAAGGAGADGRRHQLPVPHALPALRRGPVRVGDDHRARLPDGQPPDRAARLQPRRRAPRARCRSTAPTPTTPAAWSRRWWTRASTTST